MDNYGLMRRKPFLLVHSLGLTETFHSSGSKAQVKVWYVECFLCSLKKSMENSARNDLQAFLLDKMLSGLFEVHLNEVQYLVWLITKRMFFKAELFGNSHCLVLRLVYLVYQ